MEKQPAILKYDESNILSSYEDKPGKVIRTPPSSKANNALKDKNKIKRLENNDQENIHYKS